MNIERFHNELAILLGYERIVNDKRILISVEDSDFPCVTLKVNGHDDIRFKASDNAEDVKLAFIPGMQNEIKTIIDAVHQAYLKSTKDCFSSYGDTINETNPVTFNKK